MVLNAIHVYANAFVHETNSKQDYNIKANCHNSKWILLFIITF